MTLYDLLRELIDHSALNADKHAELHRVVDDLEGKDAPRSWPSRAPALPRAVPVVTPEGA